MYSVKKSESLHNFVAFCKQHIRGSEKSEAQVFLDRFFKAFGHKGALEAGATYETKVTKGSKNSKIGFADLVWKPRVLIEMKKRGEDLKKHYEQAERYWIRLAPNRPKYTILSNFDEFWIYDFENQVDTPVDIISLEQLPERSGAFTFMEVENQAPVFNNNQVAITDRTARKLGELYQLIVERVKTTEAKNLDELKIQRFLLQCVLAMFAEDHGLLPRDLFVSCIQDCLNGASTYDVLGGLFREMNQPGITPAGRYKGVDYFNGGLFSIIHPIELTREELNFLDNCARENWDKIRPSIFGNIFEGAVDPKQRHAQGIHFTSEADIRQIVRPTISDYWEEKIASASNIGELNSLRMELLNYRVLDPACGSGNFLYVAYQELKRIERKLIDAIAERHKSPPKQLEIGFVTPLQFYGIDINPFAVQLARATMMIARKIAIDKQGLTEPVLPLDTLDKNIIREDALFSDWVKADAIIGNPPFLGGKKLRSKLGDEYTNKVYTQFPEVKGQPDFCVFWFRKAADNLGENGRAGLVGTNSISQVSGKKASLDYIVSKGGIIHSAISTQKWSGDAAVFVSIVNWTKEKPKKLFLDNLEVNIITPSLKCETSVDEAKSLKINKSFSFQGCELAGKGFIVSEEEARHWVNINSKNQDVLKLMIDGKGLINPLRKLDFVIDFNDMPIEEASGYEQPFKRVREQVKPERDDNKRKARRINWWKFGEKRPGMRKALEGLNSYFAIPKHSNHVIFTPVDISILPCEANMVIASDDFYILGILTSKIHRLWVNAQSSTIKGDTRYTNTTCFETFPFPQNPSSKVVEQIRATTLELHDYRTDQMEKKQWGITQLYNRFFNEPSSQLYKLHAKLDQLVMQAYGFSPEDDILEKLLALNLELAEKEKRGESVIGAWSPS